MYCTYDLRKTGDKAPPAWELDVNPSTGDLVSNAGDGIGLKFYLAKNLFFVKMCKGCSCDARRLGYSVNATYFVIFALMSMVMLVVYRVAVGDLAFINGACVSHFKGERVSVYF